jgi:hypothetical protein
MCQEIFALKGPAAANEGIEPVLLYLLRLGDTASQLVPQRLTRLKSVTRTFG